MEKDNTNENPIDSSTNFSPTGAYQYEETKTVEPSPENNVQEFQPDDEPIIADETDTLGSSNPRPFEPNAEPQEHVEQPIIEEEPEHRIYTTEQVQNEDNRNLDAEFYQHSLQYLVQNLNNLRDTLQTILTNPELNQELTTQNVNRNPQNLGLNQGADNLQAGILNNEGQLHDQLLNIRRLLAGNVEGNNAPNDIFDFDNVGPNNQAGVLNNPPNQRNSQNRWLTTIETYAKQVYAAIPKDFNTLFWLITILALIFFVIGYTTIPDLEQKRPDYFIEWLAYHKGSKVFLWVTSTFKNF